MATYSHSKISTFEQCQFKYMLQYIEKIKPEVPTTIEAFMGDIVHRTLEKLYTNARFQKINSLQEITQFYRDTWDKEYTEDIVVVKSEYTSDNYRKMGEKYISDYYNRYHPFNEMTILGLETQDKLLLPDGNFYHIRIDKLGFVSNTYFVCDYKTNLTMKLQHEADSDRQLAMYALWVNDRFNDAEKIVLKWHMLAFNKEVVSFRSNQQLKILQEETMGLIRDIEECEDFPTNITALCDYCVYKSLCPSFKHKIEIDTKPLEEFKEDSGVKLVDEYTELYKIKKETEDRLEIIKRNLIDFALSKNINIVYGSNKKISVKETLKCVLPEDKNDLISLIKMKGLYEDLTMINYQKFLSRIQSNEIDEDVLKLVLLEKDYRLYPSKRRDIEE
ncbi:MAG TPA: PD-(D/E)XK nuclease family protein [Methanofastidiosum sp.]|nr:PD-(D/E)XK nuclease family protein [Methanofastidiosum sp.]HPA49171.1 PD-(D/E)XK nuclease family protein [Methanofastidiosum sp.]HQK62419.1 PD-(D/E)XK nuclease family protein [Methanofastidiosum sp.]HQM94630.1 PD-(D/E)XK nuclease family protein [Methanofastidiosum sp.]HQQ48629.1 PD-(D/E)XK nuclease family protein [Methanofastidiosum sp.]